MAQTTDKKWAQMSGMEKFTWFFKLMIAVATFGFAFPHVMDPIIK